MYPRLGITSLEKSEVERLFGSCLEVVLLKQQNPASPRKAAFMLPNVVSQT